MSTITQVRLWNDPGFTEGCIEVPGINNQLPPSTQTFTEDFNTNVDSMFSKITIAGPYSVLMNTSYIEVTVEWNNIGNTQVFYGWIDSVELKSDTQGFNSCNVYWHVDLWRTYLKQAQFGYGMVMRRPKKPELDAPLPPQPYPHRFMLHNDETYVITPQSTTWWIFITANGAGKSPEIVESKVYCCPVNIQDGNVHMTVGGGTAPSLYDFINGNWDEALKLTPENIKAVFLSPVPPNDYAGGSLTNWKAVSPNQGSERMLFSPGTYVMMKEYLAPINKLLTTSDTKRYVVTGLDGEVVGELPWGVPVDKLFYRCIVDSNSGYIQIRSEKFGHTEGLCFTVPMVPIEVTQNSWSSYAYTGARQSDIDQRRLNADITFHNTKQDIGANAIQDVMMGALAGGSAGGIFAPAGAAAGIAAGAASTALKYAVAKRSYGYATGEVNDRQQAINDYKAAGQPNGLIMAGSGFDCLAYGPKYIGLIGLETDEYSTAIRNEDIELFGAHVCEPEPDCTALVHNGGGLMISNLIVKGNIPVEAKAYIKARLQGGVRIV